MVEKEKKLSILALQMASVIGNKHANIKKIETMLEKNFKPETNLIVLPEVWTVGWDCEKFLESSEDINNSSTIQFLQEQAIKYNSFIIGGSFILKKNDKLYNSCPVISKTGELIAIYDKNHLFSYYGCNEDLYVERGKNLLLVNIDGVKIGLTICFDIRFPEIYREYRKKQADLLINMAAWGASKEIPWETMTKSRAIENQCYFVALTQSGKIDEFESNLGKSRIYNYLGETLDEITEGEGAIFASLDFKEMYDFREKCTILNDIHEKYEVFEK